MLKVKTNMPCIPMPHSIQLFSKFIIFRDVNDVFILKLSYWLSFALNGSSVEQWVTWGWSSDKRGVTGTESSGI